MKRHWALQSDFSSSPHLRHFVRGGPPDRVDRTLGEVLQHHQATQCTWLQAAGATDHCAAKLPPGTPLMQQFYSYEGCDGLLTEMKRTLHFECLLLKE
jgi:hypothetical protein